MVHYHSSKHMGGDIGSVMARIKGLFVSSCYAPPSWLIDEFQNILERVTSHVLLTTPDIIAGDFNIWATEWGSRYTNARGRCLLQIFASLPVSLMNDGRENAFGRAGSSSIIDS